MINGLAAANLLDDGAVADGIGDGEIDRHQPVFSTHIGGGDRREEFWDQSIHAFLDGRKVRENDTAPRGTAPDLAWCRRALDIPRCDTKAAVAMDSIISS